MEFLHLILLSLIIKILCVPPLPDPEINYIFQEYYLNDRLLQGDSNTLTITKSSLKSKLLLNGELTTLSITLKGINLPEGINVNKYNIGLSKEGDFKLLNVEISKKGISYKKEGNIIFFENMNLKNNEEIKLTIEYQITNTKSFNLIHKESLGLPPNDKEYEGEIYIYCSNELELFGRLVLFKRNDNGTYYWKGTVPNNGIGDIIHVGLKSAKWKANYNATAVKTTPFGKLNGRFIIPYIFQGGNNKIKYYKVENNNAKKIDGKNIIKDKANLIFNCRGDTIFYKIITEFSNKVSSDYSIDLQNYKYKSTATELTNKKAKEILLKDNSNDPDYLKLGKWVKRNIKYDDNYEGKQMSIEEILNKRIGVCEHFTQLYNALLHSINIPAIYTFGYAITNEQSLKSNNKVLHAWSLVKINSKWIPIDSTWGIFEGRLPVSHVFESYFERTFKFVSIDLNCKPKSKFDIQFLGNES